MSEEELLKTLSIMAQRMREDEWYHHADSLLEAKQMIESLRMTYDQISLETIRALALEWSESTEMLEDLSGEELRGAKIMHSVVEEWLNDAADQLEEK